MTLKTTIAALGYLGLTMLALIAGVSLQNRGLILISILMLGSNIAVLPVLLVLGMEDMDCPCIS